MGKRARDSSEDEGPPRQARRGRPRQGKRAAPRSQGAAGSAGKSAPTSYRHRYGVSWSPTTQRWTATLVARGSYMMLGSFTTADEAARQHDLAALATLGRGATHLNMPPDTYLRCDGQLNMPAKLSRVLDMYRRVQATKAVATAHTRVASSLPKAWRSPNRLLLLLMQATQSAKKEQQHQQEHHQHQQQCVTA